MGASPLRYKKLTQVIHKHKHAEGALLEAGFSKQTARTQAKSVLRSALKYQAKEVLKDMMPNKQSKQLMNDILGMTREQMFERIRWGALENDKDFGTGLKILVPLLKEHGVVLSADDEQKTINAPVLNLSFGTASIAQNMAKNIEPVIEHVKQQSQELDNGLTKP